MEIRAVAVVGLGTMGAGIAEVFARRGLPVTAVEADAEALRRGMAALRKSLARAAARGKLTEPESADIAGRVRPVATLAETSGADLVIEVVPENLEIKRQVLAGLDQACRPDAIIATNTSSLSVTAIAAASAHPDRVIGMHFFNPAPVMRLVEVVTTVLTRPAVADAVAGLARDLGKTPVRVSDRAGFIGNALLLPYLNHAARLAETGYASRADIDDAMTVGAGLPMGPLALLDLIGLDTSLAILQVLHAEFGGPRCQPAPLLRRLVQAGRTGRKSGAGFLGYGTAPSATGDSPELSGNNGPADCPGTVTLIEPSADAPAADRQASRTAALAELITAAGSRVNRDPAAAAGLAVLAVGEAGGVLAAGLRAGRAADTVGLHLPWLDAPAADPANTGQPAFAELVTTRVTAAPALAAARALAARCNLRAVQAPDRPGLLTAALLYPHLNDAVAMVADGYASPADIDTAMKLGCGYSRGPIELLQHAGYGRVRDVLAAMHRHYGDPAFAAAPLLAELAAIGEPLLRP